MHCTRRRLMRIGKMFLDAAVFIAAFGFSYLIRFEGDIPYSFLQGMCVYLPIVLTIKLLFLGFSGRFKVSWSHINLGETLRLCQWLTAATVLIAIGVQIKNRLPQEMIDPNEIMVLPMGVILLDLALSILGSVGVRTLARMMRERAEHRHVLVRINERADSPSAKVRVPTLLFGAGRAGALFAKEIQARPDCGIRLVGFLDDDATLAGLEVEGLPVLGTSDELSRVVDRHKVSQVIISIACGQERAAPRIAQLCEEHGLRTKIIPPLHEIVAGKIQLSRIREVSIEDLLRRPPVKLDCEELDNTVRKQVVMVTGAGGSIGSELCRIIARLGPSTLVLVEQAENSLFHIHGSLAEALPDLHIVPCIADICDEDRMNALFSEYRPRLVLHAAAHKHVPMMEWNPCEAIKNNVLGTRTIATLADAWNVERFVMISTDKAVNPTSVMGVAKRVAELFVQAYASQSDTRFMIVRFGNVLGSAGSVIPTFQRQIRNGGPVTVTHADMKRYFMTIPEACQLVLQAGAMGNGGELFVLDMGEPVKIVDLARDLISLSGLVPDRDIEIRFTGLRPGEKLFEELSLGEESLLKTKHPRIFIGKVKAPSMSWIAEQIEELGALAYAGKANRVFEKLKEIVPEYQTTKVRTDFVATTPLSGPHGHGAPTCSS